MLYRIVSVQNSFTQLIRCDKCGVVDPTPTVDEVRAGETIILRDRLDTYPLASIYTLGRGSYSTIQSGTVRVFTSLVGSSSYALRTCYGTTICGD
jgi:hypothetical protein